MPLATYLGSDQGCGYDGGALELGVQRWPDDIAEMRRVALQRGEVRSRPDLGGGAFELYDTSAGLPSVELTFAQQDGQYRARTVVAVSKDLPREQLRRAAEKIYAAVR